METRYIKIDYSMSGVNTLRVISYLAFIACFAAIVIITAMSERIDVYVVLYDIVLLVVGLMSFGAGLCLATIAESSLYQKEYIKNKDTNTIYKHVFSPT